MEKKKKKNQPCFHRTAGSTPVLWCHDYISPPIYALSSTDSFSTLFGDCQDKYVFDHVFDAGQKAVGRIVPKSFKGRPDDFFTAANIRFAKTTGMTYVARPAESSGKSAMKP